MKPLCLKLLSNTGKAIVTYSILVAATLSSEAVEFLRGAGDVDLRLVGPETLRESMGEADAVIARDDVTIDAEMIAAAKHLKVIGRAGTSLAEIDLEAATARGVIVMNTPGTNATSAAEYTLALLLTLSRHVVTGHNDLKSGVWDRHLGTELAGKTLGLIGFGRVGRRVAERAIAFGMDVIAYDPYVSELQVGDLRVKMVGLDEILARSEVISLHAPLTPETQHILDAETLAEVKPGVLIVNIAHGDMIDETALCEALQSGRVGGAALDVFEQEPPHRSPLIGLPNVIHTPHMGDATHEAQRVVSVQIAHQVIDALRGSDYRNAVNMPFVPGREYEAMAPYLRLAERIGALHHYLGLGRIRRVAVEYKGEEMEGLVKPLTVALLKGMLTPILGETVNYINAPLLAMERGIHVT
jgi:D-3-phosphoglycerate dehydrogenase